MTRSIEALRVAALAIASLFCVASLYAVATNPFPGWTIVVVIALLCSLVGGMVLTLRHPHGAFFEPTSILLPGLVIGRLLSTAWLIPTGQPAPKLGELILGESGPGVAHFETLSLVFVATVSLYILAQAQRSITERPQGAAFSASDWLVAVLRAYVGLMFISHFTGHVLAGPIPFGAFVSYFGQVGMPLPAASVVLAGLIEIAVCVCLTFGLLTRPAAFLGTFYLLFAVGIGGHFSLGYSWAMPGLGWEFPALWAFAVLLFGIFGAGPISLDARLALKKPKHVEPLSATPSY